MKTLGLYIDIPFCIARCAFCGFSVEGYRERWAARYMAALLKEIEQYAADPTLKQRPITSIYLGGGTPSHYASEVIEKLFLHLYKHFQITANAEITTEAHPATLNACNLKRLKKIGINRLSIGIQSFADKDLKRMGRHHTAKEAKTAFYLARAAGFSNIGIDLIYGLPEQTNSGWERNIQEAIALSPEHLSIYALSIEEGTLFSKQEKEGKLPLPSETETIQFYEAARRQFKKAGYKQYEISNFAKLQFESRHNLLYWNQDEILSFGVAAHSYVNHERRVNTDDISSYIEFISAGTSPIKWLEKIGAEAAFIDRVIFGLRKTKGIPIEYTKNNSKLNKTTERLLDIGLLKRNAEMIQLTDKGMLFADEVALAYL